MNLQRLMTYCALGTCLLGCGNESVTSGPVVPVAPSQSQSVAVAVADDPDLGPEPEVEVAAAPGASASASQFTFTLAGGNKVNVSPLTSSDTRIEQIGFNSAPAEVRRFAMILANASAPNVIDRRVTLGIGDPTRGPALQTGTYALGAGATRLSLLQRNAPTELLIYDSVSGSVTLTEVVTGSPGNRRVSLIFNDVVLSARNNPADRLLVGGGGNFQF